MATVTSNLKSGGVEKPKGKLEDHAAMAALYVTKNDMAAKKNREFLDSNNRLSSAGKSIPVEGVIFEQRTKANNPVNRRCNIPQIRTTTGPSKLSIFWFEEERLRCWRCCILRLGQPEDIRTLETRSLCFSLRGCRVGSGLQDEANVAT